MSTRIQQPRPGWTLSRSQAPAFVLAGGIAAGVTILAPQAWLVLAGDGLLVVGLLAAAAGWGAWPTVWLGFGRRSRGQQISLAVALGLGVLSSTTLALGVVGVLTRVVAWGLVSAGWAAGVARLYALTGPPHPMSAVQKGTGTSRSAAPGAVRSDRLGASPGLQRTGTSIEPTSGWSLIARSIVLLALAGPAAVALFGACLPPGVLWGGENFAYDVLEYHLQGPREYFDAGRIQFLPHNVYTSFPQQMEMLYLLLMHLVGGPYKAAVAAQLLHAGCGLLAVGALAAWSPAGWPRVVAALAAAGVPWLAYLGCLAYVELGAVLFAAVAAGIVLEQVANAQPAVEKTDRRREASQSGAPSADRSGASGAVEKRDRHREGARFGVLRGARRGASPVFLRAALAAGLCAGLAGGCKYTALVLVAGTLALAWLVTMRARPALRAKRLFVYAAGVLLAFAPWLVRNAAYTGNPVYPFAYSWFGGEAWSVEQDRQWAHGHQLPTEHDSIVGRAGIVWDELLAAPKFGPAVFVLALLGLVLARSRQALLLALWLFMLVVAWATLTHMPGRFVVPAVVPLALLAARAVPDRLRRPAWRSGALTTLAVLIAVVGAVSSSVMLTRLLREEDAFRRRYDISLRTFLVHGPSIFTRTETLNVPEIVARDARVWIIGNAAVFYVRRDMHYSVVFNRDPWLEYAASASAEEALAWLRTENVDFVLFSWHEIERLRDTYEFPALVTRTWARRLQPAGLRRVDPPPGAPDAPVELYEVLPR